jgi:hypothetical protein
MFSLFAAGHRGNLNAATFGRMHETALRRWVTLAVFNAAAARSYVGISKYL